jgi:hypothetical protein
VVLGCSTMSVIIMLCAIVNINKIKCHYYLAHGIFLYDEYLAKIS